MKILRQIVDDVVEPKDHYVLWLYKDLLYYYNHNIGEWDLINSKVYLTVSDVVVEYCLSTSKSELSGEEWHEEAPEWTEGMYMWSRSKVTLSNGNVSYRPSAEGTCIAGAKGDTGEAALSIQIYSSNGDTFRNGTVNTTLTCKVFSGSKDITDTISNHNFNWKRISIFGAILDNRWNTSNLAMGKKAITLTPENVSGRTVFSCEVDV